MSLSKYEQKKILQNSNSLDLTPVKLHPHETDSENIVTVMTPKFKNRLAEKYIMTRMKNKYFRIKLDKFGSFIWLHLDGKNRIQDIISKSVNEFGDEIQPADERINKFLLQLFENKLISFSELNR